MHIKTIHRTSGSNASLKTFARGHDSYEATTWLERKAKQREPSSQRRANKGHHDVHAMAVNRSEYRASGSTNAMHGQRT